MKVHEAFARALVEHGKRLVFGVMGDANMLYLSAYQDAGGRYVAAMHESGATNMANCYARVSGEPAVVAVTHGPGFTNSITALVEGVRARARVLVVTGDTPPLPSYSQRIDIAGMARAAGAGYEQVYGPDTVVQDLNRALRRIVAECRPVVLDLPAGMLEADAGMPASVRPPVEPAPLAPAPGAVDDAVAMLVAASRPLVLAGRGAVAAGARDELVGLSRRLGAPMATTLLGRELFAGEPADLGIFGSLSHSAALDVIREADCIAVFGAGLNRRTSMDGELTAGKRVLQVDTDPARIDFVTPVDDVVVGDARIVAAAMNALLDDIGHEPRTTWPARAERAVRAHSPLDDFVAQPAPGTVDTRVAAARLDQVLPRERTVVSDAGRFTAGVWPHLTVSDPAHFVTMGGFDSIGLGLAGAIGAALADPDRLTVAVLGDGGFLMHSAEFGTAVRERLRLLVLVWNDGAYGAEYRKLKRGRYDPRYSLLHWPGAGLAPLAEAMGGSGMTVRELSDLDALADLERLTEPLLVDVRVDPDVDVIDDG